VATTHLRSELLVGRSGPASKEAAAFRVASREPPPGLLFPVEFPVPMPVVPPVANQEKFRWSVDDYGTPAFPGGFGLEISSLRFVTAQTAPGSFALTDVVKGMQTPGFYLDAAPIAILSRMAGARTEAVSQLKQLSDFRLGDKATRDNYTFSNIAAQLALTGQPSMAAVYGESGVFGAEDRTAYTLVVGSPTNTLTLSSAVSSTTLAFPRAESGFQPTTVPGVAGAPGISVDAVLPVSSFVFSFRPSEVGLGDLLTLEGKTGAARQSINTSLAASAGLPAPKLEFEAVPGGGWMPFDAANTVLRTKSARVRVAAFPGFGGSGSTTVVNSGSDGTELGRANSNIIDFGGIPAVSALAELRPTEFVFTPGSAGFGSLVRPFIPVTETVTRATFVLTSDTSRVAEGFRLGVEAKVPLPPSGGFRIRFEWGDGTMTETVNQTTTSHIYGAEGSFGVVSTLTTGDAARATLAFDTVRVSNGAEAGWIISTVTDQDSLFKDGDPSDDSPTVALLKRMLAAPRSALISVDSTSPSPTKTLRLRVLPSSLWQPGTCCASIRPGEMRQTLGVDPLRRYVVGPYFAGWDTDTWAQSTTNLNTGTMTGQSLLNLAQFNVEGGGTQTGPAGGFRFNAARNGTAMTGTILLWIWEFDAEEGSPMYVNKAPTLYRFPFTATRVR
jgi:hypothetical protein